MLQNCSRTRKEDALKSKSLDQTLNGGATEVGCYFCTCFDFKETWTMGFNFQNSVAKSNIANNHGA